MPVPLKENRNDQDGDNIHYLDHGIDRRPGRVLVGIAHGVARDRCRMRRRTFPAVLSFLDIFFCVVPRATASMLKAVKMNGSSPPMNKPMITFGSWSENWKNWAGGSFKCARNSSTYEPNRTSAAKPADAIA